MAREYRVIVIEHIKHELVFEADSEEHAEEIWHEYLGDIVADTELDWDHEFEYAEPYDD
jgi:uncharacterized protein (UPF0212 family)